MQVDFHYCAVKCLARAAGFSDDEAQAIACASQYTDDSTESKPISIADPPGIARRLVTDGMFDPVCTAHRKIQYLSLIFTSREKKQNICRAVYVPFHFLPAEKYAGGDSYDYRVRRNSPWARELVEQVVEEVNRHNSGLERRKALIKLGITLHVFADTWSHESFSGRRNGTDNHVRDLRVSLDTRRVHWRNWPVISIFYDIGHAELIHIPDMSHLVWSCRHEVEDAEHKHVNTLVMMEAAETIYEWLCRACGSRPDWAQLSGRVETCLAVISGSPEEKMLTWRDEFPDCNLDYDHKNWREASLLGTGCDWDHMRKAGQFAGLSYAARPENIDWFLFHVAALEHRLHVMDNIKMDLM